MPRAASICLVQGCVKRTVRSGRCVEHAPVERPWARRSARNSASGTERRAWDRHIRPRALARDGFACTRCGARERLEVDHVLPIAQGGTWTLENAQTLCHDCHKGKSTDDRRHPRR
ncbi:HNH endonuclease [Streptomyces pseudogriseolus]|uniref:HNH endonuclease n=1 Tax=Streptomyces pseudogriseolus TaxID=36817 RepID=UPI003FA2CFF0